MAASCSVLKDGWVEKDLKYLNVKYLLTSKTSAFKNVLRK